MNDLASPKGTTNTPNPLDYVHPDYVAYANWLSKYRIGKTDEKHTWVEGKMIRESMDEIEKAMVGAGAK